MGPARFCSVLIVTAFQVMAQDATIQGQVSDESRAVIPHVAITVTNVETGISTDSQTNSSGLYSVPFLTPGVYRLHAAANGFASSIELSVKNGGNGSKKQTTEEPIIDAVWHHHPSSSW